MSKQINGRGRPRLDVADMTEDEKIVLGFIDRNKVSAYLENEDMPISLSAAARVLGVSRQRVWQLVRHPEHGKSLPVVYVQSGHKTRPVVSFHDVLRFEPRDAWRGRPLNAK